MPITPVTPLTAPLARSSVDPTNVASIEAYEVSMETFTDTLTGTTLTQMNTAIGQMNLLEIAVDADALAAAGSASTATTQAGLSDTARIAAEAAEAAAAASAASAAAIAGAFVGTSTTSVTIGMGEQTFTTQTSEQYTAGTWVSAVSASAPTNWMLGQVVSYSGSTLILNVTNTNGSGAFTDWNLSLTGVPGATGPAGPTFNGGTITTELLATAGITMSDAINESRATVASHATTADIWGSLGNQIDFTGTATVTAFPNAPQAGATRELICAGACSFTAGANMLIDGVPSGSVTCAAGDTVIVRAISTTQFKLTRLKADGTPQVSSAGGSLIFLSEIIASASATVDVETVFNAAYDTYLLIASGVIPNGGNSLQCRLKIGGSYISTATYSFHSIVSNSASAVYASSVGAGVTQMTISSGSGTSAHIDFTMMIHNPLGSQIKQVTWDGGSIDISATPQTRKSNGNGGNGGNGVLSGVRFFSSTGNIDSGTFKLYGIKKA